MKRQGSPRPREDGRHWLPSQGVDPAPLAELNAECLGLLVMRAAESETDRRGARRCCRRCTRSGRPCRRTPCGGCRPRPSACSMRALRRRRAGSSCALAASTICRSAANPRISTRRSRAPSRAACSSTAGTSPAAGRAPRAWCSGPPSPPSNRSRPVRWSRSRPPPIAMPTHCGRAGRTSLASGAHCLPRRRTAPTVGCTNYFSAACSALPQKHSQRMILEKSRTRCSTKKCACDETPPNDRGRSPLTQHNSGTKMITHKPAIAALAAVAMLFSVCIRRRKPRRRGRREGRGEVRLRRQTGREPCGAAEGGRAPRAAAGRSRAT